MNKLIRAWMAVMVGITCAMAHGATLPGTSVVLDPPAGFRPATRFAGYIDEERSSAIMVQELPGPYAEHVAGSSDDRRLRGAGMLALKRELHRIDGRPATLLHLQQMVEGFTIHKWVLWADRPDGTVMVMATYPKGQDALGESLRQSVMAVGFAQREAASSALRFTLEPAPPLRIARVIGQMVIVLPEGADFPARDETVPFLVAASSFASLPSAIDRRAFAEQRAAASNAAASLVVRSTEPIAVGPLSGFRTLADGFGKDSRVPLVLHQAVLFDEDGYYVLQGVAPTAEAATWVPLFDRTMQSLRRKTAQR